MPPVRLEDLILMDRASQIADRNPIGVPDDLQRFASIGIPVGFSGMDSNLTNNGMAVMPDGLLIKEANTYNNEGYRPREVVKDLYRASGAIPFDKLGNKKLEVVNKNMLNRQKKIERHLTNAIPDGNLMMPGYAGESTQGVYYPKRRGGLGEMYIRKSLNEGTMQSIGDHEEGHGVQEHTLRYMYDRPKFGNYKDKMSERLSFLFGGRQLPEQYTETNSSDYIHPMAMWDPDKEEFVDGSEAFNRSSKLAKQRSGTKQTQAYSDKLTEHIKGLNSRLFNDAEFRDNITTYFNDNTAHQNASALTEDTDVFERLGNIFK